jgi:hypothetical protein
VGARVATPVGAIGLDVGYNAYARRPGVAYYAAPLGDGGAELPVDCVSPGNTVPTGLDADGRLVQLQGAGGTCPESYRPPQGRSSLQRLNLNFSINQAF